TDRFAQKLKPLVPHENTRQEARFGQDLKAVADAQHLAAGLGEFHYLAHDRREAGDGTGPEIIAGGKSSGDDHAVGLGQFRLFMPNETGLLLQDAGDRVVGIPIAVRAGEYKDCEVHFSVGRYRSPPSPPSDIRECIVLYVQRSWA